MGDVASWGEMSDVPGLDTCRPSFHRWHWPSASHNVGHLTGLITGMLLHFSSTRWVFSACAAKSYKTRLINCPTHCSLQANGTCPHTHPLMDTYTLSHTPTTKPHFVCRWKQHYNCRCWRDVQLSCSALAFLAYLTPPTKKTTLPPSMCQGAPTTCS